MLGELVFSVALLSVRVGFSETAREHNSETRPGPSKVRLLTGGKLDKFETAGEVKGSELFNGADEQDAKKINSIIEYLILSVYFPMAAHRLVCYLICRPLSMMKAVSL